MDKDMNWNYEEIAKKLAMGRIDLEEASISFMLGEARKRHDGDVLAYLHKELKDFMKDASTFAHLGFLDTIGV